MEIRYFDIHTHLLYDIDHGVQTYEEMSKIMQEYLSCEFSTIVLTPHIYHPTVNTKTENIRPHFEKTCKDFPKLRFVLGSELYLEAQKNILTIPIADKYSLIEFPTQTKPINLREKLGQIIELGFIPVIAHIERYRWLDHDKSVVKMFRNLGCLIQVNVSGVENKTAIPFIKEDIVDVIGSDNHGDIKLPAKLKKILDRYPTILNKMQDFEV